MLGACNNIESQQKLLEMLKDLKFKIEIKISKIINEDISPRSNLQNELFFSQQKFLNYESKINHNSQENLNQEIYLLNYQIMNLINNLSSNNSERKGISKMEEFTKNEENISSESTMLSKSVSKCWKIENKEVEIKSQNPSIISYYEKNFINELTNDGIQKSPSRFRLEYDKNLKNMIFRNKKRKKKVVIKFCIRESIEEILFQKYLQKIQDQNEKRTADEFSNEYCCPSVEIARGFPKLENILMNFEEFKSRKNLYSKNSVEHYTKIIGKPLIASNKLKDIKKWKLDKSMDSINVQKMPLSLSPKVNPDSNSNFYKLHNNDKIYNKIRNHNKSIQIRNKNRIGHSKKYYRFMKHKNLSERKQNVNYSRKIRNIKKYNNFFSNTKLLEVESNNPDSRFFWIDLNDAKRYKEKSVEKSIFERNEIQFNNSIDIQRKAKNIIKGENQKSCNDKGPELIDWYSNSHMQFFGIIQMSNFQTKEKKIHTNDQN